MENASKICKQIKVKGYFKFNGIFPKYIKQHIRNICIKRKRGKTIKYGY